MRSRRLLALSCLTALAATAPVLAAPARKVPAPKFAPPVLLTVDRGFGGYEPSIVVDRFNNVYVTAHKQNHGLVLSPDARAALGVRSQSWIWTSKDGKTFTDMPGLTPLMENGLMFGDEGDVAVDDRGRLYYVDTILADNTLSRWTARGNGLLALDFARPLQGTGSLDDRPWVAAHGDGVVLYIGNQGDKVSYALGSNNGDDTEANGPGRYTVYMSHDGANTFDPIGYTLADSGWCRPAADHRPGSKRLVVLCTNDGGANDVNETAGTPPFDKGTLWSYVSLDDGRTWARHRMGGYNPSDSTTTYPSVSIGRDGTIYALYNDAETTGPLSELDKQIGSNNVKANHLKLYWSKDGRTWRSREVTPAPGLYHYTWMDVAPNGTLAIAYYYRPDTSADWFIYAGLANPADMRFAMSKVTGQRVASGSFPAPFGDFFQIAFGPDSKLHVSWTSMNSDILAEGLNTDIYYARQR